ncbi:hypothetical protein HNO88_000823 [Novosphingobium chloroacetimidivorans]|uniref:Uncharacterized protein n=1 Tax=Novosphingobium chloroacetimidivorans TaxID=1428314 RepID=A0A7W7K7B2_9SPHN|nr:hypothetical protein [Novosphingobium chloroacetimidivorans]
MGPHSVHEGGMMIRLDSPRRLASRAKAPFSVALDTGHCGKWEAAR